MGTTTAVIFWEGGGDFYYFSQLTASVLTCFLLIGPILLMLP